MRCGTPDLERGALNVMFSLFDARPARLEVLDVSGRRVAAEDVGTLGPGRHVVKLRQGLHSGVYFVRLSQGERIRVMRAVVLD